MLLAVSRFLPLTKFVSLFVCLFISTPLKKKLNKLLPVVPRGGPPFNYRVNWYKSQPDFRPFLYYNLIPGSTRGTQLSHQLTFHQLRGSHLSKASTYVLKREAHLSKASTYVVKWEAHLSTSKKHQLMYYEVGPTSQHQITPHK